MNKRVEKILALTLVALTSTSSIAAQEISTVSPFKVFESKKLKSDGKMHGHVGRLGAIEIPTTEARWSKDHRLGVEALRKHQYDKAEQLLLSAIHEAKRRLSKRDELIETRLVLANLYLRTERFAEAYLIYSRNEGRFESLFSKESNKMAQCHTGMARCLVDFGKDKQALAHVRKAIKILEKRKNTDSKLYGYAVQCLALIDASNAWYEDAKPLFKMSLAIFEKDPGYKNLDLAQILREQALFYHARGNRRLAAYLYERSYSIKEKVVNPQETNYRNGQIRFVWEPGSTRAKEIIDTEFPLRYMSAGDVRVAATVIDLWELLGVLITVTNVGDDQEEFELGKVTLLKLSDERGKTIATEVKPVDPKSIDRIRRERVMWDLTHTRPWLANIQKTRTVRGLVPPDGHDLFRGPNVFGVYRQWKAISHIVPARIGIMASREGLYSHDKKDIKLPGMLREGSYKVKGHIPIFLEPYESRTGDLFYLNPRDRDIVLKIPVGNTTFEIPFHTRKLKIP